MPLYNILCPSCASHFDFQLDTRSAVPDITCPRCGRSHSAGEYTTLLRCPHCATELEAPLEMLSEAELCCPQCNRNFPVSPDASQPDDFETSADALEKISAEKKTLLQENEIFDKYRILKLIGKGGMAEVYLAEHVLLKQKCALKVMTQSSFGNDVVSLKRFVREAKISHSIDHPNIIKVYDVGGDSKSNLFFIAMEYIEGTTLQQLCKEKTFSEEELLTVGIEISKALVELGRQKVVHRDIKPSNIMVTADGILKLMDMGIAKSESGERGEMTLTMDQTAIGTPSYASPEQCRSAHSVDARADIYCLGSTLYHLSSGAPPFSGDTMMEIMLKVMQKEPEPLVKLRPDLSRYTIELIEKMMSKDPNRRPQNAERLLMLFQEQKERLPELQHAAPAPAAGAPVPHFRGMPAPGTKPAAAGPVSSGCAAPKAVPPGESPHPGLSGEAAAVQPPDPDMVSDCMTVIHAEQPAAPAKMSSAARSVLHGLQSLCRRHVIFCGVTGGIILLLLVTYILGRMLIHSPVENQKELITCVRNDDAAAVDGMLRGVHGGHRADVLYFIFEKTGLQRCRSQKTLTMLLKEKYVTPDAPELFWLADAAFADGGWIVNALVESGVGLNVPLYDGSTVLEYAVICRRVREAKALIEKGADPNCPDNSGQPLIFSALDNPEMLDMLLKNGIRLNVRDWDMNSPLCAAATLGKWDSVALLLEQMQDASHVNDAGDTALTIILSNGSGVSLKMLDRLLKIPCNINAKNKKGQSALSIAMDKKQYVTVLRLLDAGANADKDFAKNVTENRWRNTLESKEEQLRKAGVEEKKGTPAADEAVPPYCGKNMLFPWWLQLILALVWIGAGLLAVSRHAEAGKKRKTQIFNLLMLLAGPVAWGVLWILFMSGKLRARLMFWDSILKKRAMDRSLRFLASSGDAVVCGPEDGTEGGALAVQIMQSLLKYEAKSVLLSPEPDSVRVILQTPHGKDKEERVLSKEKSRELIRFFKKNAGLNVLDENNPQNGQLLMCRDEKRFRVSVSTIGMGHNGERALLTVRREDSLPEKWEDLPICGKDRAVLDDFMTGRHGLLLVAAPEGTGRRTFVSLLLDACVRKTGGAAWIGDGKEPAGSDAVVRIRADFGAGATFQQTLRALDDCGAVAITYRSGMMPPKEILDLAARKIVILLLDAGGSAGVKKLLSRGVTEPDLLQVLRVTVRPWMMPKLCECALDDVPGPLLSKAWSVLGQGKTKKKNGCSECGFTGTLSPCVLYEVTVPENGQTVPASFPVWTAAKVQACLMAGQGMLAAADVEKMLKGDC